MSKDAFNGKLESACVFFSNIVLYAIMKEFLMQLFCCLFLNFILFLLFVKSLLRNVERCKIYVLVCNCIQASDSSTNAMMFASYIGLRWFENFEGKMKRKNFYSTIFSSCSKIRCYNFKFFIFYFSRPNSLFYFKTILKLFESAMTC